MRPLIALAAFVAGAALVLAATQTAFALRIAPDDAATSRPPSSIATYDGRAIDLSVSWEGAVACAITDQGNACFDTSAERDAYMGLAAPGTAASKGDSTTSALEGTIARVGGMVPMVACASSVRLYDGTSFSGTSVAFSSRNTLFNLASYSFAGKTSSFAIGACNAQLYDSASASYPGSTSAGVTAASMASGWNNRVTQVFIF
ncbi:MAG: hypothetical protein JWN39_1316 [Ilumatobacteraceae bacterium]|nr:hypothetical protein [Ilumatobacteraceae bacterium]